MRETDARAHAASYRASNIEAVARAKPHPNGWPNISDEWEVALRDPLTRQWHAETTTPQPHREATP